MGRLYDKQDLVWNTNYWNRREQEFNASLTGDYAQNAADLNRIVTFSAPPRVKGDDGRWLNDDVRPSRHLTLKEAFELERKRERFKLLRSGQLLHNLDVWEKLFKACSKCYVGWSRGKTKNMPCPEHEEGYRKAKSDVYWAGENNIAERNLRGQHRVETPAPSQEVLEGLPASTGTNELNKWETWYQRDKAEGNWPADAKTYDVDPDYKGWLNMLLQNEEMTEHEYLTELGRLRDERRELEDLKAPTDREKPWMMSKQGSRKELGFRRDTRYNQLTN